LRALLKRLPARPGSEDISRLSFLDLCASGCLAGLL
jgi:hypothetical protein